MPPSLPNSCRGGQAGSNGRCELGRRQGRQRHGQREGGSRAFGHRHWRGSFTQQWRCYSRPRGAVCTLPTPRACNAGLAHPGLCHPRLACGTNRMRVTVPPRGRMVTCSIGGMPGVSANATALQGAGGGRRGTQGSERAGAAVRRQSLAAARRVLLQPRLPPHKLDSQPGSHSTCTDTCSKTSPPPQAPPSTPAGPSPTPTAHRVASMAAYCRFAAESGRLWWGRPSRILSIASLRQGRSIDCRFWRTCARGERTRGNNQVGARGKGEAGRGSARILPHVQAGGTQEVGRWRGRWVGMDAGRDWWRGRWVGMDAGRDCQARTYNQPYPKSN